MLWPRGGRSPQQATYIYTFLDLPAVGDFWTEEAPGSVTPLNHELSYALLARARQSSELCSHFKSLPRVSDRELSADLTWRARRRKPEFPALGLGTQSTRVQGERGVN